MEVSQHITSRLPSSHDWLITTRGNETTVWAVNAKSLRIAQRHLSDHFTGCGLDSEHIQTILKGLPDTG